MNSNREVIQIPIEDLVPNRFQPRIAFDEKALNDLANSIKQHGILQPLVVRRLGDKYEIIAGERRYKAAQKAGLIAVPGLIANVNDESSAEIALVENVQRQDLSSIEEAKSYKNILDKSDMTQEELAKKMGLSQSSVANKLRLLNLNEDVQQALLENKISERHARSLLTIEDKQVQSDLLHRIIDERLTVKQLDEEIKKIKNPVRDEIIDDVPLVNIDENLEQMKSRATDINPQVTRISYDKPVTEPTPTSKSINQYFNFGTDDNHVEERRVDNEQPIPTMPGDTSYFDFDKDKKEDDFASLASVDNNVEAPSDMMVEEVLDVEAPQTNDIETLDFEPSITIFDSSIRQDNKDISSTVKEIKDLVTKLNTNNNIKLEEIDNGSSYRINIEIKKDS